MNDLQTVITDIELLGSRTLFREGFAFTSLANIGNAPNIFDAIIIRNPHNAQCFTPKLGTSTRSLQEHIDFINYHQLEKAVIIAENIEFLPECPTLKYLQIIPADNAKEFNFSPLYEMPNILGLNCATEYGLHLSQKASIDYSPLLDLCDLDVIGTGHQQINQISSIRRLNISGQLAENLTEIVSCVSLEHLSITECNIRSLSGIAAAVNLTELSLWYNRSLSNISDIAHCADSLKSLSIGSCPKVTDFSFLAKMYNVEFLELVGSNKLPNLKFLSEMKNLKCFVFNMNVLDGDLSQCLSIPYVYSQRNRKHYNLSDSELPKNKVF